MTNYVSMNKQEAIEAIKISDIKNETDWIYNIILSIDDRYAAGYLMAKAENLGESISSSDEMFRDELLTMIDWDIWEK